MLSYQHSYHAGCFADVIKHFVLANIIEYMTQKEKPLFYFESHAGRGKYDLTDKHALKTDEASSGIKKLWNMHQQLPIEFKPYIRTIAEINLLDNLQYYPGSPTIAIKLLRSHDRIFLCELHPNEFQYLKMLPHDQKKVFCHNGNGLDKLNATLPPLERRGLIFIDPSFEVKSEYITVPNAINKAYQRFKTGVYVLWYPITNKILHDNLLKELGKINNHNSLKIELVANNKNKAGMNGCGLWIINPPYMLISQLEATKNIFQNIFNLTFRYSISQTDKRI